MLERILRGGADRHRPTKILKIVQQTVVAPRHKRPSSGWNSISDRREERPNWHTPAGHDDFRHLGSVQLIRSSERSAEHQGFARDAQAMNWRHVREREPHRGTPSTSLLGHLVRSTRKLGSNAGRRRRKSLLDAEDPLRLRLPTVPGEANGDRRAPRSRLSFAAEPTKATGEGPHRGRVRRDAVDVALLTDYFIADRSELEDLNVIVGPAGGMVPAPPPKRRLLSRKQEPQPGASAPARSFDMVQTTGLEPTVTMATLEEILTGADSIGIIGESEVTPAIEADPHAGPWVFRLRRELQEALAARAEPLDDVAATWVQTEELQGAEPEGLLSFLVDLQALARRGSERDAELYCWVSL